MNSTFHWYKVSAVLRHTGHHVVIIVKGVSEMHFFPQQKVQPSVYFHSALLQPGWAQAEGKSIYPLEGYNICCDSIQKIIQIKSKGSIEIG